MYHGQGECSGRLVRRRIFCLLLSPLSRIGGGRHILQAAVRALLIVPAPLRFQLRLRFLNGSEDFAVQELVAQLAVEALGEPVLPRAARVDVVRGGAALLQPALDFGGDELRPVVAADEAGRAPQSEQRLQGGQDSLARQRNADGHREPLTGDLNKTLTRPEHSAGAACARTTARPPGSRSSRHGLAALPGTERGGPPLASASSGAAAPESHSCARRAPRAYG